MANSALLLTPSRGLGGGIERYAATLEWAFRRQDVAYRRIDLRRAGPGGQARLLADSRTYLRASMTPTRLVLAHRALLPVAALLAREQSASGISVVCHGSDVWSNRHLIRRGIENRLLRSDEVRAIAVSSFTAGALSGRSAATVLPPALSGDWFQTLAVQSAVDRPSIPGVYLVTAFRLADWRIKGLPELLMAVGLQGRSDIHVTICGSGNPPAELLNLIRRQPRCTLRAGLSDQDLASQLAAADLLILATRTKTGRHACGEGFGLVLLEAQVAGTPVIGPAYGGSRDAYLEGVTGVTPAGESAEDLAKVLRGLLSDPGRLSQMGKRAAEWSKECFAPDDYPARVMTQLL
jgi:phosphatidylinositol alpha-1,6-mannosyltransferase